MNIKECSLDLVDTDGEVCYSRNFDSLKEAKAFIKECGLSKDYWLRFSESEKFVSSIDSLRLMRGEECERDWFVQW
jgi:hypothetical protein